MTSKGCQSGSFSEKNKKYSLKFAKFIWNPIFAHNKKQKKQVQMKKVFAILAVAGLMTACNNAEKTEATVDSAATTVDTAAVAVDSSAVKVDSAAVAVDTAAKAK